MRAIRVVYKFQRPSSQCRSCRRQHGVCARSTTARQHRQLPAMTASRHWLTWTLCVRIFVYLIRIVALGRSQVLAVGAGDNAWMCFVCFEFLYERARVNFRECLIEGERF